MKRKLYTIHKWCGLVAGTFIFLLGLSGSVLVFDKEIDALEHQDVWSVDNKEPISIDRAYKTVLSAFPDYEIRLTKFPVSQNQTLVFSIRKKDERIIIISHPSNGAILKQQNKNSMWSTWILDLHYSLHGGSFGKIAVLIFGLIFLASLITGSIIYRKSIIKVIFFRVPFRWHSKKVLHASLHRYVAVWALLLNFLLVVTGLLISFDNILNHHQTASISPPTRTTSLDSVFKVIDSRYPNFSPTYIRFPKEKGQHLIVNGKVKGAAFYWTQYYNQIPVDLVSGKIYPLKLTSEGSTTSKIASVVGVIHLVEFDSFFIKAIFCLVGLSAPILTITGFVLWRSKQQST